MKNTKTKLISSVAVLLICFAMLIGSTFAWFTDSASTGVNKIQAGTLDIDAYYQNSVSPSTEGALSFYIGATNQRINKVSFDSAKLDIEGKKLIDGTTLFEPGYVGAKLITVENKGNLAAKIKLVVSTKDNGLKNALWFDFIKVGENGVAGTFVEREMSTIEAVANNVELPIAANNGTVSFIFIYGMKEEAGNEFQGKSFEASVTVLATQNAVESDSFDNKYDQNAEYPIVANTQAELSAAIDSAQSGSAISTKVALPAGNFNLENGTAQDKNITISGTKETVVTVVGDTGNQMNYQNGATLAFEGVTIQGQTAGDFGGIAHVAKTTFVNCTFNGKLTLYGDATFINCTFTNKSDYAIWTWGAKNAEFIGCTFESGGKAILLYGGAGSTETPTTNLTVNNCTFKDDGTLSTQKAAIEIGNDYDAVYNLTVNNITVNGFAINPEGISTGNNIWANKNSMDNTHLNVVIDGVDKY